MDTTQHAEVAREIVDETSDEAREAAAAADADDAQPTGAPSADPELERRRIREQLGALERKQAELRRALAIAEHPALGDAIRVLEGRAYAVARAEAKMSEGLSRAEERRREAAEKKLAVARAKHTELARQIAALESELAELGEERTRALEAERRDALEKLMAALGAHDAAFAAAGVDPVALVPEVGRLLPEVRAIAEEIVARGRDAS